LKQHLLHLQHQLKQHLLHLQHHPQCLAQELV
jgi:hypothetical protein